MYNKVIRYLIPTIFFSAIFLYSCSKAPSKSAAEWELNAQPDAEKNIFWKNSQKLVAVVLQKSIIIQHKEENQLISLRIKLNDHRKFKKDIKLSSSLSENVLTVQTDNRESFRSASGVVKIKNYNLKGKMPFISGVVEATGFKNERLHGSFDILIDKNLSWQ